MPSRPLPGDDAVALAHELLPVGVARVLKAKDLNLVRGNQFLDCAMTGEGENPLSAFCGEVTE